MDVARRTVLKQLFVGLGVGLAWGCSSPPPVVTQPKPKPLPPLRLSPLHSLVPAAGLEWIVVAKLRDISTSPVLQRSLGRMFPPARLDAFKGLTAIDIRSVRNAVVASYARSTLYIVDGVESPREAERKYRERLMRGVVRSVHREDAVLVTGNSAIGQQRTLVSLGQDVVVVESGGDARAKAAMLFAQDKLHKAQRAMDTDPLAPIAKRLGDAPLIGIAPGPFEGEWSRAVHGLLGAATGAGVAVRITPIGSLQASFVITGPWGNRAEEASLRLRESWLDMTESDVGHLTGLHEPVREPLCTHADDAASLTVEVGAERFVEGLRAAVSAQISEIMQEPPAVPSAPTPTP